MAHAHGGGFPGSVVSQEGCDLSLVEGDAETVDGRARAPGKHLHQVLDLHPHHQPQRLGLKEQLTWKKQGKKNGGYRGGT